VRYALGVSAGPRRSGKGEGYAMDPNTLLTWLIGLLLLLWLLASL
jgi:hypothetical protein